jgi:hypothetical protein
MRAKFGDKHSIQNGERTILGYYRHNGPSPISNTRRDFESAAYSETTEIPPGIYPILPGWNHYGGNGGEPTLYVEFKGKVTDDYFPSSLGGHIMNSPTPKHIGEPRTITRVINVIDAIEKTGTIPNKSPDKNGEIPPDIYIDPKCWKDILESYQSRLRKDIDYLIKVSQESKENLPNSVGQLRYASACVNHEATAVEKISRAMEYLENPTFKQLKLSNTTWVPTQEEKTLGKERKNKEFEDLHQIS